MADSEERSPHVLCEREEHDALINVGAEFLETLKRHNGGERARCAATIRNDARSAQRAARVLSRGSRRI